MQSSEADSNTGAAAIRRVLENPLFELIPLSNVLDQASFLPAGATVSVTASPVKGMDATLDLSERLRNMGLEVVPHLSAKLTIDHEHLHSILERLSHLGIMRVLVVGGDGDQRGEFRDGLALLLGMERLGHDLKVDVPAYPDGHASLSESTLGRALDHKQQFATAMTTQMCFSREAIIDWTTKQRANGIDLPITLGITGVTDRLRLLKISARIGVGDSIRYLRKNKGATSRFVLPGSHSPASLLEDLGSSLDDPVMNIEGVHIFTFNSCDRTEEWRANYLAEITD